MATYAYHIKLGGENEYLRMGFSIGWTKAMLDYTNLVGNPSDAVVYAFNKKNSMWDVDAGFAYEKNGFCIQAAPMNLRRLIDKVYQDVSDYPLFYTAVNYKFALSDEVQMNPMIAYRGIHNYNNILDIGTQFIFTEPMTITGMYHSNQSYSLGFGYTYEKKWQLICLYTSPTKDLQGLANGTFEVGLQFRVSKKSEYKNQ
jgi:type IX secretion system PorP/SprF family membrane protein